MSISSVRKKSNFAHERENQVELSYLKYLRLQHIYLSTLALFICLGHFQISSENFKTLSYLYTSYGFFMSENADEKSFCSHRDDVQIFGGDVGQFVEEVFGDCRLVLVLDEKVVQSLPKL